MDREKVKALRAKLDEVLSTFINSEFGVKVEVGSARFDANYVTFKVSISEIVDGKTINQDAVAFQQLAEHYGLKPTDLGRKFSFRASFNKVEQFEIIGLKPSSFKFPILAKRADGKVFKFPATAVIRGLDTDKKVPAEAEAELVED